jgi:hypothetical protein
MGIEPTLAPVALMPSQRASGGHRFEDGWLGRLLPGGASAVGIDKSMAAGDA